MATQFALTETWLYASLDSNAQNLRNDMKKMIGELAQAYTQSDLDEKIYISFRVLDGWIFNSCVYNRKKYSN